jgi:hypothetical protein
VELVASRLGHHIDYATEHRPELRGISMRNDLEFLNRIHDRGDSVRAQEGGKVVHAVRKEVIASVGGPVDGGK